MAKKYRRREVCTAYRLKEDTRVVGTNGAVDAAEGNWVVSQEIDGRAYTYILDDVTFRRDWVEWRLNGDDEEEDGTQEEPTFVTNDEEERDETPAPVQSVETAQPKTKTATREDEEREEAPIATTEVATPLTHTVRAAADNIVTNHDAPVVTETPEETPTETERAAAEVTPVQPDSAPVRATETVQKKRTISAPKETPVSQNDSDSDKQTGANRDADAAAIKSDDGKSDSEDNSGNSAPETVTPLPPVGGSLETRGPARGGH